jgi:hypothetical protein
MRAGTPAAVVCGGIACKTTDPRADLRALAHLDIAENFGAGANHHPFANFRVTVAAGFTGTAQGDRLQDRDVVLHHRRFTDHDAGGVVEHDAAADGRRRVDVHAEGDGNLILQVDSQRLPPLLPQPVTDTVSLQRMEPFR